MTTEDAVSAARIEVWRAVKRYRNSSNSDTRDRREDELDSYLDALIQVAEQRGREEGYAAAHEEMSGPILDIKVRAEQAEARDG